MIVANARAELAIFKVTIISELGSYPQTINSLMNIETHIPVNPATAAYISLCRNLLSTEARSKRQRREGFLAKTRACIIAEPKSWAGLLVLSFSFTA